MIILVLLSILNNLLIYNQYFTYKEYYKSKKIGFQFLYKKNIYI